MVRKDSCPIAPLPFERVLGELRPSHPYRLFKGHRSRSKSRQAGLLGTGTRMGRALLRRMFIDKGKR